MDSPATLVSEPGQQVQLTPVVQGTVSYHEWSPAGLLVDPSSLTPLTQPLNSSTTYKLLVKTPTGCEDTAFITITVYNKLYMPNSFTPNGDGKNDVFRIPPAISLKLKAFSVFDRWGNRVFTTIDPSKGWNGKIGGTIASADTYIFMVNGEDSKGPVFVKGTVVLVR